MAVLMVAVNHAGLFLLPGGYVGVDVFLVVSGFVITTSLLRGAGRRGVPIGRFYAARARRILPMAATVLIVTVFASWRLLDLSRTEHVTTDAIWAGLFGANIHFAALGTDYFASTLPPSPLQHYWSLAVEEQFYVIWPLLLGLVASVAFRKRRADQDARGAAMRRGLMVLLTAVTVASLTWSISSTASEPVSAYFSTWTRAWELALGAAVAVGARSIAKIPAPLRAGLAWLGIGGILLSAVIITGSTAFPGYAAVLPVLSTAAVIAGGTGGVKAGPELLLKVQPFQYIGDVSYSFYLWHWPVLVIAEGHAGHALSTTTKLLLLVGALGLSGLSYRIIESPVRHARRLRARPLRSLVLWPISVSLVVMVTMYVQASARNSLVARVAALSHQGGVGSPLSGAAAVPLSRPEVSAQIEAAVRAAVAGAQQFGPIPADLTPSVLGDPADWYFPTKCISLPPTKTNPICKYGDPSATRSIVIAGDSHALQWLPALDRIGKMYHWTVVPMVKIYCVSADLPVGRNAAEVAECISWQKWMIATIRSMHPQRVIIANFQQGSGVRWFQGGIASAARHLKQPGTTVTVFSDTPGVVGNPVDCLLGKHATMATCTPALPAISGEMKNAAKLGAAAGGADFVDLDSWFCADGRCPTVIGGTIAYTDYHHISRTYSVQLAPALALRLSLTR